jgi:hypothetical protein
VQGDDVGGAEQLAERRRLPGVAERELGSMSWNSTCMPSCSARTPICVPMWP